MKYTHTPEGDSIVQEYLDQVVKAAKKGKFRSLVLFGSFGKGEGLVLDDSPQNDFDLILVDGDEKAKAALSRLKFPFEVEVFALTSQEVKELPPTQQWWEVKYGSTLLAGEELNLPDWRSYQIPFIDACNSLNRRCVSMMVGKYEMMKESPDWRKVIEQIDKMIIALGDAVLIKRGLFSPRYSVRCLYLSQDTIGPLYQLAVATKTLGFPDMNPDKIWQLWHDTRHMFREYVVDNQINIPHAEVLMGITDRTTKEELEEAIKTLGAERWL